MRALFIINPASGKRADFSALESAIARRCARAGISASVVRCLRKEDLDPILEHAARERVDAIFAVGGDGTVHEVGARLIGSDLALGILPIGSGNGLARHLGISMDPIRALDEIATARVETIDTATADGRPFLGISGLGFDAEVAHRFGLAGTRGIETYAREALTLVGSYRARPYSILISGQTIERTALFIAVANSSQYGNEARIAPAASLCDGLLDVCIVEEPPLLAVPILLRELFLGKVRDGAGVEIHRAASVTIERQDPGAAHLDGEPLELPARVDYQVRPRSLRVLVPQSARGI